MGKIAFHTIRFCVQFILSLIEGFIGVCDWIAMKIITVFKKPEYVRKGACQMTGQCCRAIGMEFPKSWHKFPKLLNLVKRWHYLRYNFTYLGTTGNMLVYECNYLTKDNKCGIHPVRPKLCRDYPKLPLFGYTKLHKGCGFSFQKRFPNKFEKVLETVQSHKVEDKFEV